MTTIPNIGTMDPTARRHRLREVLQSPGCAVIPCAYDCISARILSEQGFDALAISGAGVSMSRLGLPDIGLITLNEMLDAAKRIVQSVDLPVIADVDNGFGNTRNVIRTVKEATYSGISAVQLEDQAMPKKCGHLDDKVVVPTEEFVQKVRAACGERPDPALVVIARVDSLAPHGVDDAIDRGIRAAEVGADAVFIEAPQSPSDVEAIGKALGKDVPLIYNMASGGKSPDLGADELVDLGFRAMLVPTVCLNSGVDAMRRASHSLKTTGRDTAARETGLSPRALFELMGVSVWEDVEATYR